MTAIDDPAAVFIDFQVYFCSPDYPHVPAENADEVTDAIASVNAFLERYRDSGRTPIFVRTHHDDRSNSPVWARKYADRGESVPVQPESDGAAFLDALEVRESDLVVTKRRYDAFYGTPLAAYLSANDVTELLLGGVATHVCVESAMRSAFDRDFDVTLLADCTASGDPSLKAAALDRVDGQFGRVAESDAVELDRVQPVAQSAGSTGP